jgi:Carboxypeptidase regulatory-like domain
MRRGFFVFAILLLIATCAFGQAETGSISGTVHDPSGAVIPSATITVTNLANSAVRTAETGSIGQFDIPALEPGHYRVRISSPSFQTYQQDVEVTVGSKTTIDAKLPVGATSTIVEVVGAGVVQVNTETHELSQLVDAQQLQNLPSLTRNPYDFIVSSGNVSSGDNTSSSMNSGQNLTNRGVGYAINGQRESGTEILLDGAENVSVFGVSVGQDVPVDAVQEYNVVTNNFSAEYGRASGGVVNLVTKSGSNQFHGDAWEYNRLAAYTANTFTDDANGTPKGQYTRNQFGYTVGGPILKDKLFFFASTEWTRVRSDASETAEILDPTFISMLPSNIQSYFSKYGTGALPTSGQVTTAGQLAAAGMTVGPINGATAVPASTPVFDTVNFTAPFDAGGGVPANQYVIAAKIDYNLTNKTQMFFRAGYENINQFPGSAFYSAYPQYDVGTAATNQSYLYSLNHTFSTDILDNFKASYTRYNSANSFNTAMTYTPNLMFVSPVDPATNGYINMPGLENSSEPGEGGLPFGGPQNTIQLTDDLSWTKGRHSMRYGFEYTYIQLNVAYGAYAQAVEELGATGQVSMNDLTNAGGLADGSPLIAFTPRVNPNGVLPCTENPDGSLNETAACAVTPPLTAASYGRSYRYNDWAPYVMDSFRLNRRLTLNYGLRYEHYGVQHNNKGDLDSNFYYGPGSTFFDRVASGGVQIASQSSVGGFWKPSWGTLAPRVGFAYDLTGDGKTALRGGFGISYERNFGNVTYNASFNPPASAVINATCAPNGSGLITPPPPPPPGSPATGGCNVLVTNSPLGPLGESGPASYLPPVELRMPDPNIHTAQTQFWSLDVERQLMPNTLVDISYSGAHGVHLYDIANINMIGAAQFYQGAPTSFYGTNDATQCANYTGVACLTRPNDQYAAINDRGSNGFSHYDALNVKFQTQNIKNTGLTVIANYTFAHSLDNISSTFSDSLQGGSGYIGSLGYTDYTNPKLDYGNSDFDIRHRFVLTPIWETPWFKSGRGFLPQTLGGWSVSGIFTARTGTPFSVYDYSNVWNFYQVPRLTPASTITNFHTGTPVPMAGSANTWSAMTLPLPASFAPLDPALGISDFGPYPADMTGRNQFRGPGAWNLDMAVGKNFRLTERFALEFRAEGFDVFNHHNFYVNTTTLYYDGLNPDGSLPAPVQVTEMKGGLGTLATGGNHDERRFGQFALRLKF